MPELPEVETICRDLRASNIVGKTIENVIVLWEKSITNLPANQFTRQLLTTRITTITRRGKYIHLLLDSGKSLLIHLRMTGSLTLRTINQKKDHHDRIIFQFANQELVFHDPRKFGRIILTVNPQMWLEKLGIEPLGKNFTASELYRRIHSRKTRLKTLLLDQTFIAGIGNIYADESLFLAKIHPCRGGNTLSEDEVRSLHHAIQQTLTNAISNRGTSLGNGEGNFASAGQRGLYGLQLRVYRRTDQPCFVCQTPIEKIKVSQRSTHFCPHCQT